MKSTKRILKRSLLLVFSLLITFILLEAAARIYLEYFTEDRVFREYASLRQLRDHYKPRGTPHRYLGYYPTPNYKEGENRHNSLGYRGDEIVMPKPENCFRIVCLGGSTTYTGKVEDAGKSYPALLEKELVGRGLDKVEVINAGAPGWSSWESMINFELRVLDLEPDMIIIYHAVNDIHPRIVWPPEAYRGDNSGRRSAGTEVFMPSILEYSTLLRMVMIKAGWTISHSALMGTLDRPRDTFYGNLFFEQLNEGVYPDGIFKEVSAKKMLEVNKPIYFRRNLENIIAVAKDKKIGVILATFAYSLQFNHLPRLRSKEFVHALDEMNETIKAVAEEKQVSLFDFARVFPPNKKYYTDGRHVNLKGAVLKAKMFADYIIDHHLIPSRDE